MVDPPERQIVISIEEERFAQRHAKLARHGLVEQRIRVIPRLVDQCRLERDRFERAAAEQVDKPQRGQIERAHHDSKIADTFYVKRVGLASKNPH